ncbi:gliding motility protein GldL [Pseudoprevotella muciniphila]|uniref:Gliding motility protein GldL n=1 Tax=Pseudoprevotella muciniphila TaxID=2133944 RepID=A0A5P8E718_9BACT|nr:gliding motility protein GldL [Pseudoprevotella muciniphila]QFQ12736.1 gliding motility protein GldL [Pseudoprevotella muciniphila]
MPRKINFVVRLQHWMDSVPGQTFLNYAYSWGASIVILGALFKLTHLPGGNLMLFIGMGTEVVVFFISAFDRPFDKTEVGKELPPDYQTDEEIAESLRKAEEKKYGIRPVAVDDDDDDDDYDDDDDDDDDVSSTEEVAASAEQTQQPVQVGPAIVVTPAAPQPAAPATPAAISGQTVTVQVPPAPAAEGPAAPQEQPAQPEYLPNTEEAGLSIPKDANAEQLTTIIREANNELLKRAQAVLSPEMEAVTKTYIERLRTLTDTLSKVDQQSARLSQDNEEMERLSRTLTSINSIYELQLKGASAQIVTIDQINEQTHHLVKQIEELNGVYSRMIKALTINANAAGGTTAPQE